MNRPASKKASARSPRAAKTPRRSGLLDRAVDELGRRITRGDYGGDVALPIEADLAAELDVGRNVVREAVKVLAGKGLLRTGPRVGTRVRSHADWNLLDPQVIKWTSRSKDSFEPMLRDLTEVRRLFEPAAAELAAQRATHREAAELLAAVDAMEDAADDEAGLEADLAFHTGLLASTHNAVLASFQNVISALLRADFEVAMRRPGAFAASVPLHREMAEAIADRAPARARRAAETLIDDNWRDVETVLAKKKAGPRRRSRKK